MAKSYDVCCICLEDMGYDVKSLKCGHTLHHKCFDKLIVHNKHYLECPICRYILINDVLIDYNDYDLIDENYLPIPIYIGFSIIGGFIVLYIYIIRFVCNIIYNICNFISKSILVYIALAL